MDASKTRILRKLFEKLFVVKRKEKTTKTQKRRAKPTRLELFIHTDIYSIERKGSECWCIVRVALHMNSKKCQSEDIVQAKVQEPLDDRDY